jgi:hypothetical protein
MTTGVKTGKVTGRRTLHLKSLDDVLADLEQLEAAHSAGTLRTLGNWSAGQVFAHLAMLFEFSIDGFPFKAPMPIRFVGPAFKKRALREGGVPAGIKLSGPAVEALIPPDDVSFEQGMQRLRAMIDRVKGGERMTQRSPIFGSMTHDEWTMLQLNHCALHLSFLQPQ